MTERKQHKPGVRTKLNSGDKKVQTKTDKNSRQMAVAKPNPTAVSAYKALPAMRLSQEANWAEETSQSVLSAVTPVSSERSLGSNKVVPVNDNAQPVVPIQNEDSNTKKSIAIPEKDTKNKYKKKKKTKSTNIIDDIKTSITQGFDSVKIDYQQLAQIQNELHVNADNVKSTIGDRVSRLKDYANSAMENAAKVQSEIKQKAEENYDMLKEQMKEEKLKSDKAKKEKQRAKAEQEAKAKQETPKSTVSAEELQAAADVTKKQDPTEADREKFQKLNQAIQRRDGAKNALNALNSQLQYASPEQRKSLKERIKQKEQQLAEAEALIAELE